MAELDELAKQLDKWDRGWAEMMVTIWQDRLTALRVIDTGRLWQSFTHSVRGETDDRSIVHTFLEYGLYQDMGVGSGYKMSNQGGGVGLRFLDADYRREHGMTGRTRRPRRWFSKKYYASVKIMAETRARMTAQSSALMVARVLAGGGTRDTIYG